MRSRNLLLVAARALVAATAVGVVVVPPTAPGSLALDYPRIDAPPSGVGLHPGPLQVGRPVAGQGEPSDDSEENNGRPSQDAAEEELPVVGPPEPVRPGGLALTATFESIGIALPFSGDGNANARADLEFRKAGEDGWRQGLPLWRTAPASRAGRSSGGQAAPQSAGAFYGSALLLEPASVYEVRVTVDDPDGVIGPRVVQAATATRTDAIPPASALEPTHYVRADGDDTDDGTSEATAWRTVTHAWVAAPAGAVVQVGPGHYSAPGSARGRSRTAPLTMVAQYPAVDDNREVVNEGLHSIIEPAAVSSPVGADGPNAGAWEQVTLQGPGFGGAPAGAQYTVWKWTSPVPGATQLGFATTRDAVPERVARWKRDRADLATPSGWAEKLFTNIRYSYGFFPSDPDIYLRLPGDLNPNDFYITAGGGTGFDVEGPEIRLSGFAIRQFERGISFGTRASFGVADHNLLSGHKFAVFLGSRLGGSDHVIQHNRIVDTNLWTNDHGARPAIPWRFIKGHVYHIDGSRYSNNKVGEHSETGAVWGRQGAVRVIIRFNTIDGAFNGIAPGDDSDVHDNLIRHIADDALEPEGRIVNLRIWRNRVEESSVFLSTGPARVGPIYLFRNEAWRIGTTGMGRDNRGIYNVGGTFFKYSNSSTPAALIYVIHNTLWTDQPQVMGGALWAGGTGGREAFYLRNNIIHATNYAFQAPASQNQKWNEDYNYFSSTGRGLRFGPKRTFGRDVEVYRAMSGQGAHTNVSGNFLTQPRLGNPAAGDLSLPVGSPLIDAGTPVPNISDRPGVDYRGRAPDLGAREH